ncbi:methyltransferase family protein [Humidesulfovibrio sp.]|uniref:methyltransferase family protein n=1 Tax=Humidesulfovibrio sp. TaxID=2910988 RepID=UPI0035BE1FA9
MSMPTPEAFSPEVLANAGYAFGLWTGWGALHSLMAARRVKAAFELLLGPRYVFYPTAYSAISLWTFYLVMTKEPDLPQLLWAVEGLPRYGMHALQLAGLALLGWAGMSMHGLKMLGVTQLVSLLRRRPPEEADMSKDFTSTGAYNLVRHPMHAGGILFLAMQPSLTLGGFVFALFGCLYMVVGSLFEERRLSRELGPVWADYARRVPMFVPRRLWGQGGR